MFRILCLFAMVCYVAYTSVQNTQIIQNLYLILKNGHKTYFKGVVRI